MSTALVLAALAASAVAAAAQPSAGVRPITGAGSTFAAPLYREWAAAAKPAIHLDLDYQAVGSGAGQRRILARAVDFGATDAPMSPARLASGDLLQFPTALGALVIVVNLPGVAPGALRLSGAVLADIFAGTIGRWDDPRIAALNPGLALPGLPVAPVHRDDGAGATYLFTAYLSAVSARWKSDIGANTSVAWPAGAGARGNDGVAAAVRGTPGAIGYVGSPYAARAHLATVRLRNHDGRYVPPDTTTYAAAAAGADWAHAVDYAVDLIDQPGPRAWPIVAATFVELPRDRRDRARASAVVAFFDWAIKNGDDIAERLDYIPLPAAVKARVRRDWAADIR
nr:phosphate ABC transporter substrate-binding protein PstS [Acidisphaera rubrifaciens]